MVISSIEQFLEYRERVRFRTRRVAVCIPPDKLEWTYATGKFTPGDLVRHIAGIERWMFVECVMGRPKPLSGTWTRAGRRVRCGAGLPRPAGCRIRRAASNPVPATIAGEVQHARGQPNHSVEVAAVDGRARDPSSRADLSLSLDAGRGNAAALRAHVRASARAQRGEQPRIIPTQYLRLPIVNALRR